MKYIIVIILSIFSFYGYGQSQEALVDNQSLVIIEEFVNVSCVPCVKEVDSFEELVSKDDNVVLMRYHLGEPTKDLFYDACKEDIDARDRYYNVEYLPSIYINGSIVEGDYYPGAPANLTNADIVNERLTISEYQYPFKLSYGYNNTADSLSVKIKPEFDLSGFGKRLFIAIVEKEVKFASPPGNNGKKVFNNIFRKFITPSEGISFSDLKSKLGLETEVEWSIPVPEVNDIRELKIVAFISDEEFGKILAVEQSHNESVFDEISFLDLKIEGEISDQNKCESQRDIVCDFTNVGQQAINSFTYEVKLNEVTHHYTLNDVFIKEGESYSVDIEDILLLPGGNDLSIKITSVNNFINGDHNNGNNKYDIQLAYFEPSASLLNEGFEEYDYEDEGDFTDFSSYDLSISKVSGEDFGRPNAKLGGYSQSESSVLVDFYTWDADKYDGLATMEYGEMDLSKLDRPTLVFDYTSASNIYDEDKMVIKVSADCGDSFRSIKVFEGELLNTTTTQSGFYIPSGNDKWETARIDLSEYSNQKIILGFTFKSGFGNNLYIDNIKIVNEVNTSVVNEVVEELLVYPNPAKNEININIPTPGVISIKNLYGKTLVETKGTSGINTIDISNFSTGTYIIQYSITDRSTVKKIIIL